MAGGAVGVTAANVSIGKTLELLDGHFDEMAEAVAKGEYVLWLGSGISRERVDDLLKVCRRVLKDLWDGRVAEGGAGPFSIALEKALRLALSAGEIDALDLSQAPDTWLGIDSITSRLVLLSQEFFEDSRVATRW